MKESDHKWPSAVNITYCNTYKININHYAFSVFAVKMTFLYVEIYSGHTMTSAEFLQVLKLLMN